MAAGQGGAPGSGGQQDTRVQRIEEGVAGLQEQQGENSYFDANWPSYALTPASATLGSGNAAVIVTATDYYGGLIGDNISVTIVADGSGTIVVDLSGYDFTVHVDGTTNTATEVAAAINEATAPVQGAGGYELAATQQLVTAVAGGTGAGFVLAASKTNLANATAATINTFDAGLAAGVEPGRAVAQVDTQWENSGIDPWDALKNADPSKW